MKVTKLYSTSIAAALLSTTLLTGVASAAEPTTSTTTTPTNGTPAPATPVLTAEQTAAKAELDALIKTSKEIIDAYKDDTVMKFDLDYSALKTQTSSAERVSGNASSTVDQYKSARKVLDEKLAPVIVKKEIRIAQDKVEAAIQKAKLARLQKDTPNKPQKLQDTLNKEITNAQALFKKSTTPAKAYNEQLEVLTKATNDLLSAGTVVKIPLEGTTTVKFQTADGRTQFPASAGKLVSSGVVTPEEGTKYIEVNTLRDLTKYGLVLPKGFEFANPDKPLKEVSDFSKVELKQTPGHQYSEALVTFTLKRDGQVIDSAIPNFTVLQETNFENKYSEVMDKLTADQLKDIKTYYQKEGYIVDPATTKYTFNKDNFYQTAEINFIKKPEAPPAPVVVDGPGMSSFNGYQFKAGQKYTLPVYVELYEQPNSNIQMNNKDFTIKVMSVTPAGSKKKLSVKDNKVTFTKPGNYTVKFAIYDKNGGKLKDYKGKERSYIYVSNTATVVDSAPVITGVKNTTYNKKTFSYTKGIKAYDYVDKKYVKVTYKGKVNTSKKGKYKLYYTAKDSKGNTAKKTRYVVVK
ncbi:immunoglobulin-like domain-containing protein [Macrococcus equi]|uniref:immunoglobulin-like domain-containing protein n=1 Tax=Macrococcus equi TaxID=3395462 RepID=UPI0039BECD7A